MINSNLLLINIFNKDNSNVYIMLLNVICLSKITDHDKYFAATS